jgi:hypothetical protein
VTENPPPPPPPQADPFKERCGPKPANYPNPEVAGPASLVTHRNVELLMLRQRLNALTGRIDDVQAARTDFVKHLQRLEDRTPVTAADFKPASAETVEAALDDVRTQAAMLRDDARALLTCEPVLSAYSALLASPSNPSVVEAFAAQVRLAAKACTVTELQQAMTAEASTVCRIAASNGPIEDTLKAHNDAMKSPTSRLFDVESSETSVWTAVDKTLASEADVLGAVRTLNQQVDGARLHSWSGQLIDEIVVTRQNPELPWDKIQTHSIVIKAATPYAKDLSLTHSSEETHEFKLKSATGEILGYGIGVIYTPLQESTFGAVDSSAGGKVIAETKRETRAGDLAAFLNYRFMEHRPAREPRALEATADIGVGLTSGRPAFFIGMGLQIVRAIRIGGGWAPERISVLAPDQHIGDKVSSADEIRTVSKFETKNWYVSVSFGLDALSLFNKQ